MNNVSRPFTKKLYNRIDAGDFDKDWLIIQLIGWMSEQDVKDFMEANELIEENEDED